MMHWWAFEGMYGYHWLGAILFWALFLLLAVLVVKYLMHGSDGRRTGESAEEILKKRYAAGEISREEFEEMKRVMNNGGR